MVEKLRQLKEKSHMTNQQIAGKSNIPESTVARIFSGKTPNPTVTTVIAMARAMGGSAADLLSEEEETDERTPTADADSSAAEPDKNAHVGGPPLSADGAVHEKIYEDMLRLYKEELRKKDVWIARLFWCLAGIMAFILIVLLFDILNPNFGFVKY